MENYLRKTLREASSAYYSGSPIMTDPEFDALARAANFNEVGTREGRIPHAFRMYSLQKIFEGQECPFNSNKVIVTPKLDGYANVLSSQMDSDLVDEERAVDIVLKAGGVSVHHPNIVHGSNPNTSGTRPCGLTIPYIPRTTRITRQPWECAFLLRGEEV